jgi:hypothetical protein
MTPSRADLSFTLNAYAPRTPHDGNASAMAKKKKHTFHNNHQKERKTAIWISFFLMKNLFHCPLVTQKETSRNSIDLLSLSTSVDFDKFSLD